MTTVSQATTAFMQKLGETSSEEERMTALNSEVDLNFQFDEYTPFMFAISQGCAPALVEEMLALGANPFVCVNEISALDIAAKSHQNPEVIKILARQGFDSEALTRALFLAAAENTNFRVLPELVRAGADLDKEGFGGSLPLFAALSNIHGTKVCLEMIKCLLDNGADINLVSSKGMNALEYSLLNPVSHPEVVEKLIDLGAGVNSPLSYNYTPLMLASGLRDGELVRLLLNKGAAINVRLDDGSQAIHLAAEKNDDPEVISVLVEAGAHINSRRDGKTPLHIAIQINENMAVINRLIEAGAEIEAKDENGLTPLFFAVVAEKKAVDKTKVLLAAGASAIATEAIGYTPLFYATGARNIEKILDLLLGFGADINCRAISGYTPLFDMVLTRRATAKKLQALIDRGADINVQEDGYGFNCLHAAITNKDLKTARLLIDFGIDIDLPDKEGRTALALCLAASFNRKIFQLLLESGANVNATDNAGCSVLDYAESVQDEETVQTLLQAGAADTADSDELAEEVSHEPVETKSRKRRKSAVKESQTPELVITKRIEAENFLVMSLAGHFGRATTKQFLAEISALQTAAFKDLILDFKNLDFIDGEALASLLQMWSLTNNMEKKVVIINFLEPYRSFFYMVKLDALLTILDNLDEALSFLRAPVD